MELSLITGKIGIVTVIEGQLDIYVNSQLQILKSGDIILITPLFVYDEIKESEDAKIETLLLELHIFFERIKQIFNIAFPNFLYTHPVVHLDDKEFAELLQRISVVRHLQEIEQVSENHPALKKIFQISAQVNSEGILLELLSSFFYKYREIIFGTDKSKNSKDNILPRFLLHLNQNFTHQKSVSYYASLENLSVGHFSSLIRSASGHSPIHWIITITINNAKIQLKDKDKSIKEISQALGFPEQFTFRKYFKQHTGMSPSEYRNNI